MWWTAGWINTQPWASEVVLVVGIPLLFTLSAYIFVYCEPLDIDLFYNAFEVRNHSSAEHVNTLATALKSQLGSWDRHWLDVEGFNVFLPFKYISLIKVDSETTTLMESKIQTTKLIKNKIKMD